MHGTENNKKYDCILIDVVNLAYKVFKIKTSAVKLVTDKPIYRDSCVNFIKAVESLRKQYLHFDGRIFLLTDNYHSRADLQSMFSYAIDERKNISDEYKSSRKRANKEFYNTINLARYYFTIADPSYINVRVDSMEADDLVKPVLVNECEGKTCLLVTNDLDWARYLNNRIDWLPELDGAPETYQELSNRLGFPVTELSIILYKTFFGDISDDIPETVRRTQTNKEQFLEIIKEVKEPEDIIMFCRENRKRFSLCDELALNERRMIINLTLVSNLKCDYETVKKNTIIGRDKNTLFKMLREVLEIESKPKVFEFGNVKRPRVVKK